MDFRDLNKACPKEEFPLPNMDMLIDNTAGYQMFSFMDGYSDYNHIFMAPADKDCILYICRGGGTYLCYNVMPFGLKNAGATYQRAMRF